MDNKGVVPFAEFPSLEEWLEFENYLQSGYDLDAVDAARIVRHVIHKLFRQNPDGSQKYFSMP